MIMVEMNTGFLHNVANQRDDEGFFLYADMI